MGVEAPVGSGTGWEGRGPKVASSILGTTMRGINLVLSRIISSNDIF